VRDQRNAFDEGDARIEEIRAPETAESVVEPKLPHPRQELTCNVIKLGVRHEQWSMPEDTGVRPPPLTTSRRSGLEFEEDETRHNPSGGVVVVQVPEEGITGQVFGVVRIHDRGENARIKCVPLPHW